MQNKQTISINSFNEIYNLYFKRSFMFAKSYVCDDLVAEDIASESMIKLWEKLKVSSEMDYVEPFLIAIIKNMSLNYLKHKEIELSAKESMLEWQSKDLALRITSLSSFEPDDIFTGEIKNIIWNTINGMSYQTRKVFILSRFSNKTNNEIAEELNISLKAVEYHMTKALKLLRESLKEYLPLWFIILHILTLLSESYKQ